MVDSAVADVPGFVVLELLAAPELLAVMVTLRFPVSLDGLAVPFKSVEVEVLGATVAGLEVAEAFALVATSVVVVEVAVAAALPAEEVEALGDDEAAAVEAFVVVVEDLVATAESLLVLAVAVVSTVDKAALLLSWPLAKAMLCVGTRAYPCKEAQVWTPTKEFGVRLASVYPMIPVAAMPITTVRNVVIE